MTSPIDRMEVMMALRHSIPAGLLATACALPATVFGQVSAGASLGGLSYSRFDLDLSDSHVPSLLLSIPDKLAPGRQPGAVRLHHGEYGEGHLLSEARTGVAGAKAHYSFFNST